MMGKQKIDWERKFEDHFCHKLDTKWGYRIFRDSQITVDKENCIHWDRLEQFWEDTQHPILQSVKSEFGYDWKKELGKKNTEQLEDKPLFQLLRDGLKVNSQLHLDLLYFKPERSDNKEQEELSKKNLFSVIRQYHFTSAANARQQEDERQSIEMVICLNGFAIITVKLKHTLAGQDVLDAVKQYCVRDTERPVLYRAFVHIAADDEKAKLAASFSKPPSKDDFMDFNTGLLHEKMLHTMFLDKHLRDKNAVQTISRLNRTYPGKKFDTLTVDFTNSYDEIIKAFRKYQRNVESHKEADPDDLYKIKDELLKRGIFTMEDVEDCTRLFNSENPADIAPLSALLTKIKSILQVKADPDKQREVRTLIARYVSLFGYIHSLFRLRFKDKILIDFNILATLLYKKLDPSMSSEDLEKEIENVKLKTFNIEKISDEVNRSEAEDDGNSRKRNSGYRSSDNSTNVRPLATVEEVVIAINLRFKEQVSPEGVHVVEEYLQSLQKENELKTTIKNNLTQDERQVYDLVIKGIMDKLYIDYIINHSPQLYGELTQENIQGFINQSAYRMLREILRTAA